VFSALEVFYENALYKFTFDIDIDIDIVKRIIEAGSLIQAGYPTEAGCHLMTVL